MLDIVVLGSAFVELVPSRTRVDLSRVGSFDLSIGGSATNMAVAASRLGARVGLLTAVGADDFGDFVLKELRDERIDVSNVKTMEGYRTGLSSYTIDKKGVKKYHFYRFPGYSTPEVALSADDVPRAYIGAATALALGEACVRQLPSRNFAMAAVRSARKKRRLILYDPNFRSSLWTDPSRAAEITERFIRLASIVTPNEKEVLLITGRRSKDAAIEDLLKLGVRVVVVKEAEKGCTLATGADLVHLPAFRVRAVDDTGAGDAFAAGLVVALLRGMTLKDAALLANAVGALKVSKPGTVKGMPSMTELRRFLRARKVELAGL
jgi:sugar/nucleoside kinase (ribokinase family)